MAGRRACGFDPFAEIIQRISPVRLSHLLKDKADEAEPTKSGILFDRAVMCYRHHFDFGGHLFYRDCPGVYPCEESPWQLTARF
jgi:hypothetical protein